MVVQFPFTPDTSVIDVSLHNFSQPVTIRSFLILNYLFCNCTFPFDSMSTPLTRAPREGQGPSIFIKRPIAPIFGIFFSSETHLFSSYMTYRSQIQKNRNVCRARKTKFFLSFFWSHEPDYSAQSHNLSIHDWTMLR